MNQLLSGELKITTFVAKKTMKRLAAAAEKTPVLFGSDINITYLILDKLLEYENNQKGLNLTAEQDSYYLQVSI